MIARSPLAVILALIAGCYRPAEFGACEIACTPSAANACPAGLSCGADRLCHTPDRPTCETAVDATVSEPTDSDDGPTDPNCRGTFLRVCFTQLPAPEVLLTGDLDTDTSTLCLDASQFTTTPATPAVCVVAAVTVKTVSAVRAHGSRPLVIAALGQVAITHRIDARTTAAGNGPGVVMTTPSCGAVTNGSNSPSARQSGGGGGAGGSFGGAGGPGGGGDVNGNPGGTVVTAQLPTTLQTGCAGGSGGNGGGGLPGPGAGPGGTGGRPGGVVAVIGQMIVVGPGGAIDASGGGGGAGISASGGGGGGTGGMIVFDAMNAFSMLGFVNANGGGGGSGCSLDGGQGDVGDDGGTTVAIGGDAGLGGRADGGRGSFDLAGATTGIQGQANEGGGGGGGGAGLIRVVGAMPADVTRFSPRFVP